MDDKQIVDLYFARSERAIDETARKYGRYCHAIAHSLLGNDADAEECVNDTYLAAWNAMPPHRPSLLSTFLGKLTRRISVDRFRRDHAKKRSGELCSILDELEEALPSDAPTPACELEQAELARCINTFLASLAETDRRIFLRRYFYGESIAQIAKSFTFTESRVKSLLHRTRQKLRTHLELEGYNEIP